jgi:hypothetical protein
VLNNFTFTLYEIFGYLMPGSITFAGMVTLYWALFNSHGPLRPESFNPQVGIWALLLGTCYILGHAAQALGNRLFRKTEERALEMKSSTDIRHSARKAAASILGENEAGLKAKWVYRALDEYAVQNGIAGDRDMFVYREGFYRGTCIALFFAAASLVIRAFIPGTTVVYANWSMNVTWHEFAITTGLVSGLGILFYQRYRRFVEYRVSRAALAALVLLYKKASDSESSLAALNSTDNASNGK